MVALKVKWPKPFSFSHLVALSRKPLALKGLWQNTLVGFLDNAIAQGYRPKLLKGHAPMDCERPDGGVQLYFGAYDQIVLASDQPYQVPSLWFVTTLKKTLADALKQPYNRTVGVWTCA